jgi:hypothetical protein
MGTFVMAELEAVKRGNRWRIQTSWPDRMPRFFGDFENEAEAALWIKEHNWLAPDKPKSAEIPDTKPSKC